MGGWAPSGPLSNIDGPGDLLSDSTVHCFLTYVTRISRPAPMSLNDENSMDERVGTDLSCSCKILIRHKTFLQKTVHC